MPTIASAKRKPDGRTVKNASQIFPGEVFLSESGETVWVGSDGGAPGHYGVCAISLCGNHVLTEDTPVKLFEAEIEVDCHSVTGYINVHGTRVSVTA